MRIKTILSIFCCLVFGTFCSNVKAEGKIHMIFVWGTNEVETNRFVEHSKNKIYRAFEEESRIAFSRYSSVVATNLTIMGTDATPKNIIRIIREVSDNANQNDAVMVYILCHGLCVDTDDGKKHFLLPGIRRYDSHSIHKEDILARSDAFAALASSRHRLNVLITDSCSTCIDIIVAEGVPAVAGINISKYKLLELLLLNGQGTLNINSTNPNGGLNEDGERALAWLPPRNTNELSGTVFTNAFIGMGGLGFDRKIKVTPEMFFAVLKEGLHSEYKALLSYLTYTGDTTIREIASQETQTLTAFRPDGTPDDSWNNRSYPDYLDMERRGLLGVSSD